jgi:putative protein kinase ArgK-like GTPase of G3E family
MSDSHSSKLSSFVLRFVPKLWRDEQGEPHFQWRGQIRHVQGDEETGFTDFADAVAFMQRHLAQLTMNTLQGGATMEQEKLYRDSFKLWEQFASTYTNLMFEAMEKTIKQSETIREQMDEAVSSVMKAWQLPARSDQGDLPETLGRLQAQVDELAGRIAKLEKAAKKS